jgi:hypothetical protein
VSYGPLDVRLWCSDGELVRNLSTEVRPVTDLHLRDFERATRITMRGRPVEPTFVSVHQRGLSSSPRTADCRVVNQPWR